MRSTDASVLVMVLHGCKSTSQKADHLSIATGLGDMVYGYISAICNLKNMNLN